MVDGGWWSLVENDNDANLEGDESEDDVLRERETNKGREGDE
ncbi:unnamed protein product [Camellia sinensis]